MASETVYWGQRALAEISSVGTGLANVSGVAGQTSLNVTGNIYSSNSVTTGNLITNNIIMASNMSSGTGFGNVYFSGNLVVTGNIFSSGGSVGSGSGTSQGILFSLGASGYTLPTAFSTGTAGPTMNGYHINLTSFDAEAAQAVTQFGAGTGLLKFVTAGLYQVTCVIVGDQPVAKVAMGKTASLTSWTALQASGQGATTGYDYVYNYPVGSSPSEIVTLPLTVTDITQYYYLDVFFSTAVAAPTVLYPTRSTTAAGSNFGTYVQVAPFGNHLTSATGVAAALLCNCSTNSNLSAPVWGSGAASRSSRPRISARPAGAGGLGGGVIRFSYLGKVEGREVLAFADLVDGHKPGLDRDSVRLESGFSVGPEKALDEELRDIVGRKDLGVAPEGGFDPPEPAGETVGYEVLPLLFGGRVSQGVAGLRAEFRRWQVEHLGDPQV